MRSLLCLVFTITTLLALNPSIKAESPKDDVTLIIIASSNSNFEFLTLQASNDSISWFFKRDDRYKNEEGEYTGKDIQNREGKVAGKAENLTAAFSKVMNLEKQPAAPLQIQSKFKDDWISPYDFAMVLIDSTGVKTCQLGHKQQVLLSYCEELKPIFDIARTEVALDKRVMMIDLLYAGREYLRSITKATTGQRNKTNVSQLPPTPEETGSFPKTRNNYPPTPPGNLPGMKSPN